MEWAEQNITTTEVELTLADVSRSAPAKINVT